MGYADLPGSTGNHYERIHCEGSAIIYRSAMWVLYAAELRSCRLVLTDNPPLAPAPPTVSIVIAPQ